jgi:hypothetical protein
MRRGKWYCDRTLASEQPVIPSCRAIKANMAEEKKLRDRIEGIAASQQENIYHTFSLVNHSWQR